MQAAFEEAVNAHQAISKEYEAIWKLRLAMPFNLVRCLMASSVLYLTVIGN